MPERAVHYLPRTRRVFDVLTCCRAHLCESPCGPRTGSDSAVAFMGSLFAVARLISAPAPIPMPRPQSLMYTSLVASTHAGSYALQSPNVSCEAGSREGS